MRKKLSRVLSTRRLTQRKKRTTWDKAISDAQEQIEEANQRIACLREAIATFQSLRDTGAAFPGEKPKQRKKAA
jgi:hypothetical protein